MPDAWEAFYSPDFPVGWRYPSELERPSSSLVGNLAILMLSRDIIGNDIVEALGLYLAADSRFNVWYGEGAGGVRTPREMAELRASDLENLRRVYEAWKVLDEQFDTSEREMFDVAYSTLLGALRSAVEDMCRLMGESLADFGNL